MKLLSAGAAAHAAAAILLASSACTPPAVAISQPMRQAVLEVADAAYPVVASVRSDAAGPFAVQAAALFAAASPLEVARTAEKLSDALLSIPPERLDAAAASWKSAYADVARSSSCNVPLPPTDALRVAASAWDAAAASADPASVAAAARVARPLLSAVVRNEEAICLPPLPAFETAALATADALASADPAALSAASRQARAALGSVPRAQAMSAMPQMQQQATRLSDLRSRQRLKARPGREPPHTGPALSLALRGAGGDSRRRRGAGRAGTEGGGGGRAEKVLHHVMLRLLPRHGQGPRWDRGLLQAPARCVNRIPIRQN